MSTSHSFLKCSRWCVCQVAHKKSRIVGQVLQGTPHIAFRVVEYNWITKRYLASVDFICEQVWHGGSGLKNLLLWMFCGLRTEELSSCDFFPKSVMMAIKPPLDLNFQGQHSGLFGSNALCSIARQQNKKNTAVQVCSFSYSMGVETENVLYIHYSARLLTQPLIKWQNCMAHTLHQSECDPWASCYFIPVASRQVKTQKYPSDVCMNSTSTLPFFEDKDTAIRNRSVQGLSDRVIWEVATPAGTHT